MYPNNPDGSIANFIIFPLDIGWELYLHEDMYQYGKVIERCLAVTETIKQMITYTCDKVGNLRGTDILIKQTDMPDSTISTDYIWIVIQPDGIYSAFEDFGSNGRKLIDEDEDINLLINRIPTNDVIMSF